MPGTHAPTWDSWDQQSYAKAYHGRELTLLKYTRPSPVSTTNRDSYPSWPPLYWKKHEKPSGDIRPVPSFPFTTSHRAEFKEHDLKIATAPVRHPYPKPQYHPKLSTRTEGRDNMPSWPELPPPRPKTSHEVEFQTTGELGTTTMRADYREWELPKRHVKKGFSEKPRETKFHARTETRERYFWPNGPDAYGKIVGKNAMEPYVTGDNDWSTEHRGSFEEITLPKGLPATIGLQVASDAYKAGGVGGQFELMFRQGIPAPCVASKVFTTVVDGQTSAGIVVVAKRPEFPHGVILGSFTMQGIEKAATGVPKIEVTLKLADEKTLQASAWYKNGNRRKALTFRAARGPNLRTVATVDDVPDDF